MSENKCSHTIANCDCQENKKESEAADDTIIASTVRSIFGDAAAETFKDVFGHWF